jgi:hypothetical protein
LDPQVQPPEDEEELADSFLLGQFAHVQVPGHEHADEPEMGLHFDPHLHEDDNEEVDSFLLGQLAQVHFPSQEQSEEPGMALHLDPQAQDEADLLGQLEHVHPPSQEQVDDPATELHLDPQLWWTKERHVSDLWWRIQVELEGAGLTSIPWSRSRSWGSCFRSTTLCLGGESVGVELVDGVRVLERVCVYD